MLDVMRDRIKTFLDQHPLGILTTCGSTGAWASPAWQVKEEGLKIICLLPRWSDSLYNIEQDPEVLFVIVDTWDGKLRWLYYRGSAQRIEGPDWDLILRAGLPITNPEHTFAAVRITPTRVDLIDESRGWSARETLEF